MSLSGSIKVGFNFQDVKASDFGTAQFPLAKQIEAIFTNGAGLNQGDKMFTDQRTLSASANEDLDLAGVLLDAFGVVISFARVKAMFFRALSTNPAAMTIKPAAANGFNGWLGAATHTITLPPGGIALLTDPTATGRVVTAATADLFNVAAGAGGNHVYDVIIIGAST